jgi:guanine deaminase
MQALAAAGMSGYVGQVLMDRNAPAELLVPAREALASAAALKAVGRISPAVTPRFAVTCSEEMLRGAGELAKKTGWLVQTHLAETVRECALVAELFAGESYAVVYEKAGLLGAKTVLGHGIWLGDEDHARLRQAGSVIAHCPTANRFLEAGEMDRARALAAGVRVSLGSDVAGGPDRSMVRVARGMLDTAKQVRRGKDEPRSVPGASECWWQITAGNADAIGLVESGRLEPGMWGNVAVIRPREGWMESVDPLAAALYAWDDRWIEAVLAGGKVAWPESG